MQELTPTSSDAFVVTDGFGDGTNEFSATLKARKIFTPGEVLALIRGVKTDLKDYRTLQCGPRDTDNFLLADELVYANHSCDPNVVFDLSSQDPSNWHVRALKPINPGDDITFFYPSTEWDMDQPFQCCCGTAHCLGTVRGGKYLTLDQLRERRDLSPWILALAKARDS